MAASLTATNTFGSLAAGNQNLSLFDQNFSQLYTGLNTLNNFGNYYADSGSASAYAITVPTVQSYTFAAGLPIMFKALTASTGASTLQITSGSTSLTKSIVNFDGSAIGNQQIAAGAIVIVVSDGTNFQYAGGIPPTGVLASTFTWNGTGSPGTSTSVSIAWMKDGPWVDLNLPSVTATTGTNSTTLSSTSQLPLALRPTTNQFSTLSEITNNAGVVAAPGVCQVNTSGNITIFRDSTGATFTNGALAGTNVPQGVRYFIG